MSWDLLIRQGLIIDGSGAPGVMGDLAIASGRIGALGATIPGDAKRIINADGLAVAPGFPRVLSRYVHDERLIPLEQAIYKMTGGRRKRSNFANVG